MFVVPFFFLIFPNSTTDLNVDLIQARVVLEERTSIQDFRTCHYQVGAQITVGGTTPGWVILGSIKRQT